MGEIFKDIKGCEGWYTISNFGRVFSYVKNKNGRELVASPNQDGYPAVRLSKPSPPKMYRTSRLVALHFIKNPMNYKEVNHIDGNKANNVSTNLEWCSRSQNIRHAYRAGLRRAPKGSRSCRAKPVICICLNIKFDTVTAAAKWCKRGVSHISEACNGKRMSCAGYKWKYADK